ncbi:MAG: 2OG-Fe(II) oxygenase [Pseudomonadales bacterium]|nr:2OG-Fe(II) oxygenase [Pseudomonadales bacterium]
MVGLTPLLDYHRLEQLASEQARHYQHAEPFPHIAIDHFIDADTVHRLLQRFPELHEKPTQATLDSGKFPQPNKLWLSNQAGADPLIRHLYWELNSAPFLHFLETLTGIKNLIADPHMAGGGVHETLRDGLLMIHADFNKHPHFDLDRRLNILIYLNPDWQDEWGGHLELWERDMSRCVKKISPLAGRCVIFSTQRDSFHGHPHPLVCPPGQSRKSIAQYYYTQGRPANEDASPHKTLWQDITAPADR